MNRRKYLNYKFSILLSLFISPDKLFANPVIDHVAITRMQKDWKKLLGKDFEIIELKPQIEISKEDRLNLFTPLESRVLFEEGTEAPYSSAYNYETREGIYACRACSLALFSSEMQYDSKTGWPSFFTSVSVHLSKKTDYRLIWPRTEYHCAKCGSHQGHVFNDGPPPTGERWCNNGASLVFLGKGTL